jgi:hypothetical protein
MPDRLWPFARAPGQLPVKIKERLVDDDGQFGTFPQIRPDEYNKEWMEPLTDDFKRKHNIRQVNARVSADSEEQALLTESQERGDRVLLDDIRRAQEEASRAPHRGGENPMDEALKGFLKKYSSSGLRKEPALRKLWSEQIQLAGRDQPASEVDLAGGRESGSMVFMG